MKLREIEAVFKKAGLIPQEYCAGQSWVNLCYDLVQETYDPYVTKGFLRDRARKVKIQMHALEQPVVTCLSKDEIPNLPYRTAKKNRSKSETVTLPSNFPSKAPASKVKYFVRDIDVSSAAFLNTAEWKKLRYEVLLESNKTCKCCGSSGCVLNVDHIKPRKIYPELAMSKDNLQVLCADCNQGKGNWDETRH